MNNAYSLVRQTPENGGRAVGPPLFLLLFLSFLFLFFLFSLFLSFLPQTVSSFLFCSPLRTDHIFHLVEFFFFFILHFIDTWFPCVTFTFICHIPMWHKGDMHLAMWHLPPTWHLIYGHDAMWHPFTCHLFIPSFLLEVREISTVSESDVIRLCN